MIIRNDSADSEEEVEDEFTELLRQIEEQRQIERPLHNLELREGSPVGHLDRHHQTPSDDNTEEETCCIDGDELESNQHFLAAHANVDKYDALAPSAIVSPLPKNGLKSGDAIPVSTGEPPIIALSSHPKEPIFPILVKRVVEPAGPVAIAAAQQEAPSRKVSPRKILLKRIDRNLSTPIALPLESNDGAPAPKLGPTNKSLKPEPMKVLKMSSNTQRHSVDTMEEDDRGTCTSPDSAMDMLLEEMEGYVAENNILYHEQSPEQNSAPPSKSLDHTSKESLQDVAPSSDVSKHDDSSTPVPLLVEDKEGQESSSEDVIMYDAVESHSSSPDPPKRRVRFADDHGLPLTRILHLDRITATEGRLVILLLSPPERTFEFIQVEYPMDDCTTVNDLVEQLPGLATNSVFQKTNCFVGVSRIRTLRNDSERGKPNNPHGQDGSTGSDCPTSTSSASSSNGKSFRLPTLLDATALMRDIDFGNCELVLAVLDGYTPAQMVTFAFPLLLNGKIMKAVQSGRRSGRGLKYVLSGKGWRKQQHKHTLCLEEERHDWHKQYPYREWAVVDSLCDNVIVHEIDIDEYADSWEEMKSLNVVCGMNGVLETDISTVWDDWWTGFQPKETVFVEAAPRTLKRGDDAVEIQPKEARNFDSVNESECQPSSGQGETSKVNVALEEVSPTEWESSPRSVVDTPGSIACKSVPLQVSDYNHEITETLRNEPDPVVWGYIGGQQGAENVIMMIYAFSVAGVAGLLSRA